MQIQKECKKNPAVERNIIRPFKRKYFFTKIYIPAGLQKIMGHLVTYLEVIDMQFSCPQGMHTLLTCFQRLLIATADRKEATSD